MEALITPALLLAQGIIMLSLGIGLTVADFKRVLQRKFTFTIALLCQMVILPAFALALVYLFSVPAVFAAGIMLLSFCPGGVTSNIIAKLSHADVALSVSLTAVVSVVSFITVPPLTAWAVGHFIGQQALTFSFFDLAFVTFCITTTPVLLGVVLRQIKPHLANILEPILGRIAIVLWLIIVGLAIVKSADKLAATFNQIGPSLLLMPLAMMLLGIAISRVLGLTFAESKTLGIETSIQNGPMAIAIAATISGGSMVITELALPAAVYSITMYLIALPFVFYFRKRSSAEGINRTKFVTTTTR